MVLTGGDYVNAYISSNGSQMVWAIDLASGSAPAWTLIGPWCNGPVQPGRPDTVGWVYDSKRDQGVLVPGYVFANEGYGYTVGPDGVSITEDGRPTTAEPFIALQRG